jgi:hypothetical protein
MDGYTCITWNMIRKRYYYLLLCVRVRMLWRSGIEMIFSHRNAKRERPNQTAMTRNAPVNFFKESGASLFFGIVFPLWTFPVH